MLLPIALRIYICLRKGKMQNKKAISSIKIERANCFSYYYYSVFCQTFDTSPRKNNSIQVLNIEVKKTSSKSSMQLLWVIYCICQICINVIIFYLSFLFNRGLEVRWRGYISNILCRFKYGVKAHARHLVQHSRLKNIADIIV